MDVLVQIHLETEENIVGVERVPVRKAQALPEFECVPQAVRRNLPGFRERGFGELRGAVDMHQVGLHHADHFPGRCVRGEDRVQRLWLSAQRNNQPAA